jgi:predicted GTPase
MVISRILRCHYGVRYHTKFLENKHDECDKYWNELRGVYYADNQMEWYLLKVINIIVRSASWEHHL